MNKLKKIYVQFLVHIHSRSKLPHLVYLILVKIYDWSFSLLKCMHECIKKLLAHWIIFLIENFGTKKHKIVFYDQIGCVIF